MVFLNIMAEDRAWYGVIGHDRKRASLADLCELWESASLTCTGHLCKFLNAWGSGAPSREILVLRGADFSDAALHRAARCQSLRMFTSFEYFFSRMRKPQYS